MNEKQAVEWLWQNWPSIAIGLASASIGIRVWMYSQRIDLLEHRMRRVMRVCSAQHPELGAKLFDDEEKNGK